MKIQAKSKLILIGDSITDAGRVRPVGESAPWNTQSSGNGYASEVNAWITAVYPERNIRVLNLGESGNNVRDLKARWKRDVLDHKPEWLSIFIGINDVWRQFDHPLGTESHVPITEYEKTLGELAGKTRKSLKGLVMMTPYYLEPNPKDPMRQMILEYGAVVKKLAKKNDAIFVDLQAAFDKVLAHRYSGSLGWDRIHPLPVGHAVITRAFLHAVGFDFQREPA